MKYQVVLTRFLSSSPSWAWVLLLPTRLASPLPSWTSTAQSSPPSDPDIERPDRIGAGNSEDSLIDYTWKVSLIPGNNSVVPPCSRSGRSLSCSKMKKTSWIPNRRSEAQWMMQLSRFVHGSQHLCRRRCIPPPSLPPVWKLSCTIIWDREAKLLEKSSTFVDEKQNQSANFSAWHLVWYSQ